MKKSYIFLFSNSAGTRSQMENYLNRMSNVIHWRTEMGNSFFIVSENTAHEIAKEFESIAGTKGRFIFIEYNENAQGRLTEEGWYLLKNKVHKPKDEAS